MTNDRDEEVIQLPLVWMGVDESEIVFTNQLIVQHQHQGGEFILTFGQQAPPVLLGEPGEDMERAKELEYVPVRTVVRVGLTAERMAEFVDVMQQNLEKFQRRGRAEDG